MRDMPKATDSNHARFWRRIQGKLLLLLLVLFVPTILIQVYIYHKTWEGAFDAELRANLEIARATAREFETFVQEILHQESAIGTALTPSQPISIEEQNRILDKARADQPVIRDLVWVNPQGVIVAGSHGDSNGLDLSDRPHIRRVLAGADWAISDLILTKIRSEPAFTIARAVRNEEGSLLGVVSAVIFPDRLSEILGVERLHGGAHALVDSKGMLVFRHPAIKVTWENRDWLKKYPELKEALAGKEITATVYGSVERKKRLVAFAPMASIGWAVTAGRNQDVAMSSVTSTILLDAALYLIVFLGASCMALVISRSTVNGLKRFRDHALAVGRGEHQNPVATSGTAELDDLANAFNKMNADLQTRESERNLAEAALRQSQTLLSTIVESIPFEFWAIGQDGRYMLSNSVCTNHYGNILGKKPEEVYTNQDALSVWREHNRKAFRGKLVEGDIKFTYREVESVVHNIVAPIRDGDQIKGILGVNIDIAERKRLEEELCKSRDELELRVKERTALLEKANEELQQIPSKLIAVLEEERKRLASELHDSIGQTLAAIKFWVEMALKFRDSGDANAALNHLDQFVPILQHSIEETRSIYMGLRPSMLDTAGLLATLEWLRRECMKLYPERHIELEVGIAEETIPKNLKVNIFRIAQEALNNIAKHSKAEWVDISLSMNGGGIELVVSDDGVGMDLDTIIQTHTSNSLGLTSMRERAELTGGSFSIESASGEGATIRASWPIEAEDRLQRGGIIQ